MLIRGDQLARPSNRSLSLAAAVAVGLLIAFGVVALHHARPSSPTSSGPGYLIARPAGAGPFGEGEKEVTLDEAISSAPYHVYRPEDALASDKTTTKVWTVSFRGDNADDFNVAIHYQSGVEVLIKPNQLRDPLLAYSNIVKEWGGTPYITTVQGSKALVIPQSSDETGQNPGSVDTVFDGIEVSIIGHLPDDELLQIADSVQ